MRLSNGNKKLSYRIDSVWCRWRLF